MLGIRLPRRDLRAHHQAQQGCRHHELPQEVPHHPSDAKLLNDSSLPGGSRAQTASRQLAAQRRYPDRGGTPLRWRPVPPAVLEVLPVVLGFTGRGCASRGALIPACERSTWRRRARLARRHRLAAGQRAGDVVEAAASMVCLHATDPATIHLSARARVDGMQVADLERALYVDRSLVKHMAMRRTLFVFPRETMPFAQAGASNRVADAERRRLIRDVEAAGLHRNGERWLARASEQVLAALSEGREATSSELRAEIPLLEGSIDYGEGKSWGGRMPIGPRVLTAMSAGGHIVRATNDGGWATSRPRWTSMKSWLGEEIDASPGSRGRGRSGRAVAAHIRPRDRGRHQVVARVDRRGSPDGAGRPARGRGRSRRADRIPAARRPGGDRSGPAVGGAPAAARSDHDGLVRAGLVPRPVQGATVRHGRQRRAHRVVGRADRGRLAPERQRARSSCRCSRTSAPKDCAPSSTRPRV